MTNDKQITEDPTTIANTMNQFFSSIGQQLNKTCNILNSNNKPPEIAFNPKSFHLEPVSPSEIYQLLKAINVKKSSGPNNIPNYFIKISAQTITPTLTILINLCFTKGIYPNILKKTTIIPIHKSGDKNLTQNHRPINLISSFSKIVEKCLVKRMNSFLNKYKILNDSQFGFRRGLSTENAVSLIYNKFSTQLDNNKIICSIFLDIKKAFDSVDHKILLNK